MTKAEGTSLSGGDGVATEPAIGDNSCIWTPDELRALIRHWAMESERIAYSSFLANDDGRFDWDFEEYISRRLIVIGKYLGEEASRQAETTARDEFAKRQNAEHWDIYVDGSTEERLVLLESLRRGVWLPETMEMLKSRRQEEKRAERVERAEQAVGENNLDDPAPY